MYFLLHISICTLFFFYFVFFFAFYLKFITFFVFLEIEILLINSKIKTDFFCYSSNIVNLDLNQLNLSYMTYVH